MAAKVLFFGQDARRCIPVLESAGYAVDAYASVVQIPASIVEDSDARAVAMSGSWQPFLNAPISIAREKASIPFILFAGRDEHPAAQSIFDLVVPAGRQPSQWLIELDLLIRECQATCAAARRVAATSALLIEYSRLAREQSRLAREQSRLVREQSRLERERSRSLIHLSSSWDRHEIRGMVDFASAPDVCAAPCEERDRLNWSIMMAVAELTGLLVKTAKVHLDHGASEQIDALQAEEKSLASNLEALLMQWKAHRAAHGC